MISLLILFFLIAVVVSFLCSLWEAALLSITPSFAQMKLKEGSELGRELQEFKENIDRPLAAILTLNTIAHTVGAIGVGNQAALIWGDANPFVTSIVIPAVMTLGILVLSELIPKTIGANYWRELAPFTVNSLRWMIKLLSPLIWFSQLITRALKKDKEGSVYSRSDFLAMTELGAEEGVFEEHESSMLTSLLKFNTVRAKDVMTPSTVVIAAPEEITIRAFYDSHRDLRFSRIPLYENGSRDHISGFFLKDEVLERVIHDRGDEPLDSLRRDVMMVEEDFPIPELFKRFLEKREHIAIVVDEFGGMEGVVTTEDVLETLLGMEIVDETDHAEDMQTLARKNWEKRARAMGLIDTSKEEGVES